MIDNWWHLAQTPTGAHAHQLDPIAIQAVVDREMNADPELIEDEAVSEVLGDLAEAIRRELGFPLRNRWLSRRGWSSQITTGQPHPKFLESATVHTDWSVAL